MNTEPIDVTALASAVLAQRHDPAQTQALPLPPIELITLFCDAIHTSEVTTETRVLVLKALRSSWSSEAKEIHPILLSTTLPLLADVSIAVRTQASSLLIHVVSTASAQLVTDHVDTLASSITKSLSPYHLVPPTSSALRLVSLSLRLLNAALLKLPSSALTALRVDVVLSIIAHWIYYDRANPGLKGPGLTAPPDRLISHPTNSPFTSTTTPKPLSGAMMSFGAMASFSPTSSPSSRKTLSRSSSQTSLNTVSSIHADTYKSDSETDDDQASVSSEQAPRLTSGHVRLDALAVLKTLASAQPKLLYPRWNLFFCDSAYVRSKPTLLGLIETDRSVTVRLRAARILELMFKESRAFLAIAEDRPTKASFTSLSSKLGTLLAELHLKLTSLLSAPSVTSNVELLLALLTLVETLGNNAPYARLRQKSLTRGLAKTLVQLTVHHEHSIALAAMAGLIAVTRSELLSSDPASLDLASMIRQVMILAPHSSDPRIAKSAWELLCLITPHIPESDLLPAIALFDAIISTSDATLTPEQISFYSALFKTSTIFVSPPSESEKERLVELVRVALRHPSPVLKVTTAQVLVSEKFLGFLRSSSSTYSIDVIQELLDLTPLTSTTTEEEQDLVAAAVYRSLGQVIKSDYFNTLPNAASRLRNQILPALMRRCSISCSESVVSMASWAFANSIDILFPSSSTSTPSDLAFTLEETSAMFNIADTFLKTETCEPIQTNGIRSICLLLRDPASCGTRSFEENVTHTLITILQDQKGKGVKVRWNAATGLGHWLVGLKDRKPTSWRGALRELILDALIQVGIESILIHLLQQSRSAESSAPQVQHTTDACTTSVPPTPPLIILNYKISIQCVRALRQAAPLTVSEVERIHRARKGSPAPDLFAFLDQVKGKERGHDLFAFLDQVKGKERGHAQMLGQELRALLLVVDVDVSSGE
ncbi:BZ3500_MvSof-1268-A1-R1_Chr6-3g08934 [Microbotryum saponariae]|uniref:BZ3500_MvSof-1268-A1-R1_Chr6-3g08934 protein n=1 Tax=Microbotryum saponariae TaxID=289078 RepID=A0A2X0KM10_9BASI|nr:BZ3500_MvSof-1268-A1-R1_Chr6-3g08934 [Microbotryum saponariae]SDA07536.1 BZ3501_MvSof-1269-A2-R1_Chr6-2g08638 [Microbotryum saponariae]